MSPLSVRVLLSFVLASGAAKTYTINKCCPVGQELDVTKGLACADTSGDNQVDVKQKRSDSNETDPWYWFPTASIVNATTMKIHPTDRTKYLKILEEQYEIVYGNRPRCEDGNWEGSFFKASEIEFFNFILQEDFAMRVHVSKWSSLHRRPPKTRTSYFDRVEAETPENVTAWTADSVESLRTFPLDDVCVDAGTGRTFFIIFCPCREMTCIRKCCSDGEFWNASSRECEYFEDAGLSVRLWRPPIDSMKQHYYLLSGTYPSCDKPLLLKVPIENYHYKLCNRFNKDSDNNFTIYPDGSVKVNKYKNPYPSHQYCGEVTWHGSNQIYEQNLIICSAKKTPDNWKPVKFMVYGCLLIIGGVCLLITVGVSLFLPELRRRIHNKIALSHNSSLMIAYFAWGVAQLCPNLDDKSCIFLSLLIQFTFLGSFFWLNVMCIDISTTFSTTRSLGGSSAKGENKKFLYYCIYAWGTTSLISVVTIVMEFIPEVPYDVLRPGFTCSCGFNTGSFSILIYFYGPMSLLLVFNLVLFVFTTIRIMRIQRQTTAILHKTDSNATGGSSFQSDKQRYDLVQWLILYGKLFLLMGLTWVTEIVSWAVGGPEYYWYFSDILNLLRGVFIFIIFICKKPVLRSLKHRLRGESMGLSFKTGSSKSTTDGLSITLSRDSRHRTNSTNSNRKKSGAKSEVDTPPKDAEAVAQRPEKTDESRV